MPKFQQAAANGRQGRGRRISTSLAEINVVPLEYRQTHMVYLGTEKIRADVLQERVRQKMETATQKDVFLRGDSGVNLGEAVEITDMLTAAGVERVGLVTKMPGER